MTDSEDRNQNIHDQQLREREKEEDGEKEEPSYVIRLKVHTRLRAGIGVVLGPETKHK